MQIINKKGFSFLELMIVIAIAGIMTAVMLVSMNEQRDKKAVEGAAREVASVIRETQNYALTGKGLTASSPDCSYNFYWDAGSVDYGIDRVVNGKVSCKTQNYTLKNGVNFSSSSGGSVSFSVPFSTTSPANIELDKNGNKYCVRIFASGIISENSGGCS